MKYNYVVLGAGRQGLAIAYDLVKNGEAKSVKLADSQSNLAREGASRINRLTHSNKTSAHTVDAKDLKAVSQLIQGADAVVSALPYFFNYAIAKIALENGSHFTDLGGNTEIVQQELKLDSLAKQKKVSLAPDCGLAPGMSNVIASYAISQLGGKADQIRVRCGGLPQKPKPPFGYKMVFSLYGLINEYSGDALVLRNGKVEKRAALTELEPEKIPGLGELEAAVTTGGTSTAPFSFKGKVQNFDYKTLRYPGHFAAFKAFSDLGLFEKEKRDFLFELLEPKIRFDEDKDMVVLSVDAVRKNKRYRALIVDKGDSKTGFTAMERTTGFPTALITHLQASGKMPVGAIPIERSVPLDPFMKQLKKRTLKVVETSIIGA